MLTKLQDMKKLSLLLILTLFSQWSFGSNSIKDHVDNGNEHTVALQCNGQVWAWGLNTNGQLGNNSTTQSSLPVQVRNLTNTGPLNNVLGVAAGSNHSLAILCDGTVAAWGANTSGQLGDNSTTQRLFPVLVQGLPVGVRAVSVMAGDLHSMALLEDGTVWAWGENSSDQLGDGTGADQLTAVQVVGVGGVGFLTGVVAIETGEAFSLALMSDGTMRGWGKNNRGQLGIGSQGGTQPTPVITQNIAGTGPLMNIVALSGGDLHSIMVLSDGSMVAMGERGSGQLGDGLTNSFSNLPTPVLGITTAVDCKAGYDFSTAILANGTVMAWGANAQGQLGDNSIVQSATPVQVHGVGNVGFLADVLVIAAGRDFVTVIVDGGTNGTFRSWGDNISGQLGDGTQTDRLVPVVNAGGLIVGILTASFTPLDGATFCLPPGTVTFTVTGSTGGTITHTWDFGPGASPATSTSAGPVVVTYSTTGPKTVTLITSDGTTCPNWPTCSDTAINTINIIGGAEAAFTSTAPGCEGQEVNFYNAGSSGSGVTHFWDFGAGATPATSTLENPMGIVYATAGGKNVSHTVVYSF